MLRLGICLTFLVFPAPSYAQESLLKDIGVAYPTNRLPNGDILYPPLSYDGRYIAFHATADNIAIDDTNGVGDVFVLDQETHLVSRVIASDGSEPNGQSTYPSLSGSGRYLTFTSEASNFSEGDENGRSDVFLADISSNEVALVSRKQDGTSATGMSYNYFPAVSSDGAFVVFNSDAPDLVDNDRNETWDVFLFDRTTETILRISERDGADGNGPSMHAVISGDGKFIAYHSMASNLVDGDTNEASDIFLYSVITSETKIISRSTDGMLGNARSERASISHDGNRISYSSDATNLVQGDTNNVEDVFVFDQSSDTTTRVSVTESGEQLLQLSAAPLDRKSVMSADGTAVAFRSGGGSLAESEVRSNVDIYLHRIDQRTTERISTWPDGSLISGDSEHHALNFDASVAAFTSQVSRTELQSDSMKSQFSVLGALPESDGEVSAPISLGLIRNNETGAVSFIGN